MAMCQAVDNAADGSRFYCTLDLEPGVHEPSTPGATHRCDYMDLPPAGSTTPPFLVAATHEWTSP